MHDNPILNVLGEPLLSCCHEPMTGFYRDSYCRTGDYDTGRHVICAVMTEAFLEFTKAQGNDLSTPRPEHNFAGLKADDRWCLCALRWKQAYNVGVAPPVILASCDTKALEYVTLEMLKQHAHHHGA
jgi:uncharacterized protein